MPPGIDRDELIRLMAQMIVDRDDTIEKLLLEVQDHRRQRFGRRSEKKPGEGSSSSTTTDPTPSPPPGQTSPSGTSTADSAENSRPEWRENTGQNQSKKKKKRKPHGRAPLPPLPRETAHHDLAVDEKFCDFCHKPLQEMASLDAGPRLEYRPSSLIIIDNKRRRYVCKDRTCPGPPKTAPLPPQVIDKGKAAPGMLAYVVVSKFVDHLPLYRLRKILLRQGVKIATSTLGDWAAQVAGALRPLYELGCREVLLSKVIRTDDTPVRMLDKSRKQTREGRIWAYLGDRDHPFLAFDFTPHHRSEAPQNFLSCFTGYIQADAFGGYDVLFKDLKENEVGCHRMIEVGCNVHGRRYFEKLQVTAPHPGAAMALAFVQRLYIIEDEAAALSPEQRKTLRQEKARPIFDEYHDWLEQQKQTTAPKSGFGIAIRYSLKHWNALTRYLDDGDLEIDNNAVERVLRVVAVGRRNWLFFGSENGGQHAAILYSFVQSAIHNGLEPLAYLTDVLTRLPLHPRERLAELLPHRWKALRDAVEREKTNAHPPETMAPD